MSTTKTKTEEEPKAPAWFEGKGEHDGDDWFNARATEDRPADEEVPPPEPEA